MMDCDCELCVHLRTAAPKVKITDLSPEQIIADIGRELEAAFVRMARGETGLRSDS